MTTQPESAIVNAILAALNALPNTHARKTHGNGYSSGWPDIVGAHRGRMLALEVKRPGKQATPRQAHELRKWELAGAIVGVVHDVDEALAAIDCERCGGAGLEWDGMTGIEPCAWCRAGART